MSQKSSQGRAGEDWQEHVQRTSLEALENVPHNLHVLSWEDSSASSIPLPELYDDQSWTEISDENQEEQDTVQGLRDTTQQTSLEALVNVPLQVYSPWAGNPNAPSIPIPDSVDGLSLINQREEKASIETGQASSSSAAADTASNHVESYAQTINTFSAHLPHLKNVLQVSTRRRNVTVECYDYSDNTLTSKRKFSRRRQDDFYTDEGESLYNVMQDYTESTGQLRLIIAEDLSTELIACMGSSLNISPEVFEEHLLNSGWRNGRYDDDETDTWVTRDMTKSYTTLRWFRPVKRKLQRPYSESDWESLLNPRGKVFSWVESVPSKDGKNFGVQHDSKPTTNIIRNDLDLKTDVKAFADVGDLVGWEEKATLWSRQSNGCRIILLLLDPLPILREELSGSRNVLEMIGVYQPLEGQPVSSQDERHASGDEPSPQSITAKALVRSRTQFGYEGAAERSIFQWILGWSQVIPVPAKGVTTMDETAQQSVDPEKAQGQKKRNRSGKFVGRAQPRKGVSKFLLSLVGNTAKKTKAFYGVEEPEIIEERVGAEKIILQPLDRCVFDGLFPRGPMMDYDLLFSTRGADLLADHLDTTKSTARAVAAWLCQDEGLQRPGLNFTNPLHSLFVIAQRDTLNILRLIDKALKEIGQQVLDDTLIQQRLVYWRHLLERFEAELQGLENSMNRFAKFIQANVGPSTPDAEELKGLLQ